MIYVVQMGRDNYALRVDPGDKVSLDKLQPPFRTRRLRDPTIPYEQPAFRRKKAPECV